MLSRFSGCGLLLTGVILALGPASAMAADPLTSENNPQLKRWLEQFPEADADGDGILTEAEARAYRDRVQRQRPARGNGARPAPTHADVPYGSHQRQVLDLYVVPSEKPTPLLIFIHGGGFVGGDKAQVSPDVISRCHAAKVSVAAVHYRFVTTHPFPAPQQDVARAVQFLRSRAEEWNLDPERLAAYGGSAGAGLSMWLGFHDDLADPDNPDPVARQSTRLKAVGSLGGQSTYDPNVIQAWVGGRAHEHPSIYFCYGIQSIDQINDPKLQPLYDEVSAIKHLTADDPPVFMIYSEPDGPLPANARPGQGIHHPVFGHKLKAELDRLGIENVYQHTADGGPDADRRDMLETLLGWLQG